MKTALVTTCWLGNEMYIERMVKWLDYQITLGKLRYDAIILLDNASSFSELGLISGEYPGVVIQRFTEHFDRPAHYDYPYLWRAVDFYQELFKEYDKIIYMDNDFYVLSRKFAEHIASIQSNSWVSPWCARHNFPETGLQVITKDCQKYQLGWPWKHNNGQCMEHVLPVQVEKQWVGDRYSEGGILDIPENADYCAQTLNSMKMRY